MSPKYADSTSPRPRRAFGVGTVAALGVLIVILLSAVGVLVVLLIRLVPHNPSAPLPKADQCMVNLEEHQVAITLEQAENVSIIVAESIRRGLGPRAATIALVTAWQESGLRNLDYGDLDSIGLFQQRPSQGWGTVEQILDPWYSAGKFYEVLITIDNWDERDITEVAQAVQRSAYPDAYRQHEWKGRVWASSLRGWSSESLTCRVHQSITGSTANISSFLTRTYGSALPITINANSITLSAPNELEAWAIAQLALARIGVDGVSAVQVGNRQWVHDPWDWGLWIDTDSAAAPNPKTTVIITLNP